MFTEEEMSAEYVSFGELLEKSDFIIIACPLNDYTREIFNEDAFSKMKRNAIVINVSRGGNPTLAPKYFLFNFTKVKPIIIV